MRNALLALTVFTLFTALNPAIAGEACTGAGTAVQKYISSIKVGGSLNKQFLKQVAALTEKGVQNDLYSAENLSVICIAQGVSMSSGQTFSRNTFLIGHSLRVSNMGLVNDASLLATVSITAEDSGQDSESSAERVDIKFTALK